MQQALDPANCVSDVSPKLQMPELQLYSINKNLHARFNMMLFWWYKQNLLFPQIDLGPVAQQRQPARRAYLRQQTVMINQLVAASVSSTDLIILHYKSVASILFCM